MAICEAHRPPTRGAASRPLRVLQVAVVSASEGYGAVRVTVPGLAAMLGLARSGPQRALAALRRGRHVVTVLQMRRAGVLRDLDHLALVANAHLPVLVRRGALVDGAWLARVRDPDHRFRHLLHGRGGEAHTADRRHRGEHRGRQGRTERDPDALTPRRAVDLLADHRNEL